MFVMHLAYKTIVYWAFDTFVAPVFAAKHENLIKRN